MGQITPATRQPQRPGRQHAWSIGIYTGTTPFCLTPPEGINQPILTAAAVTDLRAEFVADPFLVRDRDRWYLFFEVMPCDPRVGVIGLAESADGLRWSYRQVVLREPFHLSYPDVVLWQGDYYMTPETLAPEHVRLYRAVRFPDRWEHVSDLIPGRHADPTVFQAAGECWMFTCDPSNSATLRLYDATTLHGAWTEHPRSPIIGQDRKFARPAGRVVSSEHGLLRFAQDCSTYYGLQVHALRIEVLSGVQYREKLASPTAIVGPGQGGWNRWGMHHVDAHPRPEGGWIAAVDGR